MSSPVMTIDVAHPPRGPAAVEEDILDAWTAIRNSPQVRILKVIHGYGSSGVGGATRDTVRNWAYVNRGKFRAVIHGEDYALLDPATDAMRREAGGYPDTDLSARNPGVTVIWVK